MGARKVHEWVGGKECFFDSVAEYKYAHWLEGEKQANRIRDWWHHPDGFPLHAPTRNGRKAVGTIEPDFRVEGCLGVVAFHEVKGMATALWRWKRRHFEAQYPLGRYVVIDAATCGSDEPQLFDTRAARKRARKVARKARAKK